MQTFSDIETLWKRPQQQRLPDATAILKNAAAEKNQVADKIFLQVFYLFLAILSLIFVLYKVHFFYTSSYLGIGLMFICVTALGVVRLRQAQFLRRANFLLPPLLLLKHFERFYKKLKWLNTKGVLLYNVLLNGAFALYFYELIIMASFPNVFKITLLIIYVSWTLTATLWIGRRRIKKEHEKVESIILNLQRISDTFI